MSAAQLAWLVGLSGLVASIPCHRAVRKSPGTRLAWFAVIAGTMMAGWAIGVHDGHWLAAGVCSGSIAGLFVLADPPRDAKDPNVGVIVGAFAVAVVVFGSVVYYDAIPVCGWWHKHYVAYQQTPTGARAGLAEWDWDLCASAFEIGNRAGGTR